MTFATSSPAASAPAGQGSTPPVCQNCTTSTTPLWRRDEAGSVLCNACGLFLKLHGRPRPISLKTDVIKSRNRVKNAGQPLKKKASLFDGLPVTHPAPRSENGTPPPGHRAHAQGRSVSPQSSRSGTPLPPPSHIFDHALLNHPGSDSPTLPALSTLNQTSPPPYHTQQSNTLTMDQLIAENNKLKTRVAELELVNDLFRGRVGELESSEASAKRAEICRREVETHLRQSLEGCTKREEDLKRKLEDCEQELAAYRRGSPSSGEERQRKKVRVSDLTQ